MPSSVNAVAEAVEGSRWSGWWWTFCFLRFEFSLY